jgi:hypothetical protein
VGYLSDKWNMKSIVNSDGDDLLDINDDKPVEQDKVHGVWGAWSGYGSCEGAAGQYGPTAGSQTRTRTCEPPKYGGNACPGLASESQDCNIPRPGGWSNWIVNSGTDANGWKTCTDGQNDERTRTCNNPTPAWGGAGCVGSATEERTSTSKKAGYWTPWQKSSCLMEMWAFKRTKVAPVCGGAQAPSDGFDIKKFEDAELHWQDCAQESQTCNFSQSGLGQMRVRYGLYGHYNYGDHSSGIACSNGVFGDPLWGYTKQCHYTCPASSWNF